MNLVALGLSVAGFATVMGTWVVYLGGIPRGRVPVRPVGSVILQCMGIALAASAIVWGYLGSLSSGAAVIVPAVFALLLGPAFLWILTQRKTPIGELKVEVGDQLLAFGATTSEGAEFHSDELAGKRTLLKFFRGHW